MILAIFGNFIAKVLSFPVITWNLSDNKCFILYCKIKSYIFMLHVFMDSHTWTETHTHECTGTHIWIQRRWAHLKWKAVASLNTRQLSLMWLTDMGKNRSSAVWVFVHWLYHTILISFYFFLGNDNTFCFARYYYWVNCQSLRESVKGS